MSAREFTLVSPEGVPLTFRLATMTERVLAFLIDMTIVLFATILLGIAGTFLSVGVGLSEPFALSLVGIFILRHGYFAFFEVHWHGSTPGKRLLSIQVVSRDGAGLSTESIVARNLFRDMELFLPLIAFFAPDQLVGDAPWWLFLPASGWCLLFFAMPLLSKERTRAGDLAGGTVVVQVPKVELAVDQAGRASMAPAQPGVEELVFTRAQLSIYGEHELETLADLIRKADAGRADAHDLSVVAKAIANKIDYGGPEPSWDAERFLRVFYKQQRVVLEKQLLFGKRKASKFDE